MPNYWYMYLEYLKDWADTHRDLSCAGQTPASYREWYDNERVEADDY